MCESNVYLKKSGQPEELLMENVAAVTPSENGMLLLKGLLGESMQVKAMIEDINLMGHRITLTAVE